jgi:hypothetical protein
MEPKVLTHENQIETIWRRGINVKSCLPIFRFVEAVIPSFHKCNENSAIDRIIVGDKYMESPVRLGRDGVSLDQSD